MLDCKEIGLYFLQFKLEPFLHIGIALLVFKIEVNLLKEKDWLKRIASCLSQGYC